MTTTFSKFFRSFFLAIVIVFCWSNLASGVEVAEPFANITRDQAFAPLSGEPTDLSAEIYAIVAEAGDDYEAIIETYTGKFRAAQSAGNCHELVIASAVINRSKKKRGDNEPLNAPFAAATCEPLCAPFFYYPALIEFDAGRYLESLTLLKKALPYCTTQKERINVLMTIGACASGLGEVAESVKFAQWAYEQSPKPVSWQLVVNISSNLMGLHRLEEAVEILRQQLSSQPDNHPAVYLNKMQAHAMMGQTDSVWTTWAQTEPLLSDLPWSLMTLRAMSSVAVLMPTERFWREVEDRAVASGDQVVLDQIFDENDLRGLLFPQAKHALSSLVTSDSIRWQLASQLNRQIQLTQSDEERAEYKTLSTAEARALLARVKGESQPSEPLGGIPVWPLLGMMLGGLVVYGIRQRSTKAKSTPAPEQPTAPGTASSEHQLWPALRYRLDQKVHASVKLNATRDRLLKSIVEHEGFLNTKVLPKSETLEMTEIELEVLVLSLLGTQAKVIAQICDVSVGHVYNVRTSLRTRLGADALTIGGWL